MNEWEGRQKNQSRSADQQADAVHIEAKRFGLEEEREREEVSEACTDWLTGERTDGWTRRRLWERDVHLGVAAARERERRKRAVLLPLSFLTYNADGETDGCVCEGET